MEEAGVDELAGQCYRLSTLPQILFGHCYITITDFIRIHGQSLGGWVAAVFFPAVHHCVYVMLQSQSSFGLIVVCGCDCDCCCTFLLQFGNWSGPTPWPFWTPLTPLPKRP